MSSADVGRVACESGATIARGPRRTTHVSGEGALPRPGDERWIRLPAFDVHPNQVTREGALEDGAADVFGPGGGNGAALPAIDVKSLHAKIGELTLENDFLEGALTKAGLLSAKR